MEAEAVMKVGQQYFSKGSAAADRPTRRKRRMEKG